jgi:hypothetical protein
VKGIIICTLMVVEVSIIGSRCDILQVLDSRDDTPRMLLQVLDSRVMLLCLDGLTQWCVGTGMICLGYDTRTDMMGEVSWTE